MRQITNESVRALMRGQTMSKSNMHTSTHTAAECHVTSLYLHGNLIAEKRGTGPDFDVILYDAGWQSTTTKERLNGVLAWLGLPHLIYQKDYEWFINGEDWHGSVTVFVRAHYVVRIQSTRPDGVHISVPLNWIN